MVEGAGGDQRRVWLLCAALRIHLRRQVLDVIGRFLGLRGCLHQHRGLVAQDLHPAREVGGAVGEGDVRDTAHAAEV